MVGNAVARVHQLRAGDCLLHIHIVDPVTAEKRIMNIPPGELFHLLRGGGVAARIYGDAAAERDQPADALPDVVVAVVPGLHGFHRGITKVEGFVVALDQGFLPGDNPAVVVPLFDHVDIVMVLVPVGDQDQVGGKIVSLSDIGIDVDDLSFRGDDAKASVALVQKPVAGGRAFRHGGAAAQQEQGKGQDAA